MAPGLDACRQWRGRRSVDNDSEWRAAPLDRNRRTGKLGHRRAVDGEGADLHGSGIDDVQVSTVRGDGGVERPEAGRAFERGRTDKAQRAVARDGVTRDR